MPCENFKDAIAEVAAAAAKPEGKLRAHLNGCEHCCAAFTFEKSLYASIDSGVRVAVNSGVPPSLLPSVRSRLQEVGTSQNSWIPAWPAVAGAALAVFAVAFAMAGWHLKVSRQAGSPSQIASTISPTLSAHENSSILKPAGSTKPDVEPRVFHGKTATALQKNPATSNQGIEVLVPVDQEILLAGYAKQMHKRNIKVQPVESLDVEEPSLLQIDLIQIAQLDVKPLADEVSK